MMIYFAQKCRLTALTIYFIDLDVYQTNLCLIIYGRIALITKLTIKG